MRVYPLMIILHKGFNRYIVECKFKYDGEISRICAVLIDT